MAVALLVAGCSQIPPQYDPVNWIQEGSREVKGWFSDQPPAPEPIVEPPPAEGRPIPNLGTVPLPPLVTPEEWAERRKQMAALEADRAAAAKADAALRARTGATAEPGTGGTAGTPPASRAAPSPAPPPAADRSEPSVSSGAAPAPLVQVPSLPSAEANAARSAAHLLTTSERHGVVRFGRGDASVSADGRNTLDAAATAALMNDGRVRLVPVRADGAAAAPAIVAQREKSMREVLAGAGVPADRVTIVEGVTPRADAYNVFVDY